MSKFHHVPFSVVLFLALLSLTAPGDAVATPEFEQQISGLLLQSPASIACDVDASRPPEPVHARVRVKGLTGQPGPTSGLEMQLGFGPANTLPGDWPTWQAMAFSGDSGEWEDWSAVMRPEVGGEFIYLVRARLTETGAWVYGGLRSGIRHGGRLTVTPSPDSTPPASPMGVHVKATRHNSITLAWDANVEPDLYGYEVYRRPLTPGAAWVRIAAVPAAALRFRDYDVVAEAVYHYYLRAVDTSYNRSTPSGEVTGKADALMVEVTLHVTVPSFTPLADAIHITGNVANLGGWNTAGQPLEHVDETHWTTTFELLDETVVAYLYTRGDPALFEQWTGASLPLTRTVRIESARRASRSSATPSPTGQTPSSSTSTPRTAQPTCR